MGKPEPDRTDDHGPEYGPPQEGNGHISGGPRSTNKHKIPQISRVVLEGGGAIGLATIGGVCGYLDHRFLCIFFSWLSVLSIPVSTCIEIHLEHWPNTKALTAIATICCILITVFFVWLAWPFVFPAGGTMPTSLVEDRFKGPITATVICFFILAVLWYRAFTAAPAPADASAKATTSPSLTPSVLPAAAATEPKATTTESSSTAPSDSAAPAADTVPARKRFTIRRTQVSLSLGSGEGANGVNIMVDKDGNAPLGPWPWLSGPPPGPIMIAVKHWELSLDLCFNDGERVARMIDSTLVDPPPRWQMNQDNDAIEVVDEIGRPVWQIVRTDPSNLILRGIFSQDGKSGFCADTFMRGTDERGTGRNMASFFDPMRKGLRRMFLYPAPADGSNGKRAPDWQRRLTKPQKQSLLALLQSFPNVELQFRPSKADGEASIFSSDFDDVIQQSGIKCTPWPNDWAGMFGIEGWTGTAISISDKDINSFPPLAIPLTKWFEENHIANMNVDMHRMFPGSGVPTGVVLLSVGRHPPDEPFPAQ